MDEILQGFLTLLKFGGISVVFSEPFGLSKHVLVENKDNADSFERILKDHVSLFG